jgi:hypothetical protein
MISKVEASLRMPSWWMPDSCAKALRPDDRLVGLDRVAGDVGDEPAGAGDLLGLDAGLGAEVVAARADRHDDLFERGVAGALADAVDGALDLRRAGAHGGERVGDGEPEVVVAVAAHGHVVERRAQPVELAMKSPNSRAARSRRCRGC